MVCPPGLEPGPGASEALMVSNSTTGTLFFVNFILLSYFTLFCFLFASDYAIIFLKIWKNLKNFSVFAVRRAFFGFAA